MITPKEKSAIYHSFTRSICNQCDTMLDAKIMIENGAVYVTKSCPEHGFQKGLLESDAQYYLARHAFDKPGTETTVQTQIKRGCPFDCGLCPDHDQHTCIGLIEITQRCNMNCPLCYANSAQNSELLGSPIGQCSLPSGDLTLDQINTMMDFYQASELDKAEILQISGGEPTCHPQILEILKLAMTKNFKFVMLNTNGLALLDNPELVQLLASFKTGFEVYLQFDGLEEANHKTLRGQDPTPKKRQILELLKQHHIPTTLVVVVEETTNFKALGTIIQYAMDAPMIRGVNFQPLAYYSADHPAPENRITLTGVLKAIETQTNGLIRMSDFIPLPCNVERVAINYMIREKDKGALTPVAKKVNLQSMLPAINNTLSFKIEDADAAVELCSCMKGLPKLAGLVPKKLLKATVKERLKFIDTSTFRLTVTSFVDRYNFDLKSVQKECVHIITPDLKRMPFSTYNMVHRKGGL